MQFGAIEIILPTEGPQAIEDAAATGYDGFEYYVDGPDPADDPIWTPEGRARIRRRAGESGIAVPSVCLGFFNDDQWLTAPEEDRRDDAVDVVRRAVDVAVSLDSEVIQVPFFGPGEITTDAHEQRVIEEIREVAADAAATDVTLTLENTLPAADNVEILDAIDSPAVEYYYDVANMTARGCDPAEELRTLGDRVEVIHIKDMTDDGTVNLGEGDVDFEAVAEAIEDIGFDGWLIVESFPAERAEMLPDAETNLAFTRDLVSG